MAADRPFRFGVVSAQAGSGAQWAQRARQLESMGFSTLLEPVTLGGRHYQVDRADVFPAPVQRPRPPLLVAGAGDRLLELAAREADIVAIGARPPMGDAEVGERVEHVRRAAGDRFARLELN